MKLEVPADVVPDLEIWKPVVGYEGIYEVSNHGRVKSLLRCRGTTERILRPWLRNRFRYHAVNLYVRKHRRAMYVHRLVLTAFVGPHPVGYECRHLDGNPVNNRIGNLCWGTHAENEADSVRHGTFARGERQGFAKLTDDGVCEIRDLLRQGLSQRKIARLFGVSHATIYLIKHGKTWAHVPLTRE